MSLLLSMVLLSYVDTGGFDLSIWPVLICGPVVIAIVLIYLLWVEWLGKKK